MAKENQQLTKTLLDIRAQHYGHVQHIQRLTSAYLSVYVGVNAAALAAFVSSSEQMTDVVIIFLASIVWIFSLFFLIRSELLSAHVTHNLIKVRKTDLLLQKQNATLQGLLIAEGDRLNAYIEIRRKIWDTSRGIEGVIGLLGAGYSSAIIALVLWRFIGFSNAIGVVVTGLYIPILYWDVVNNGLVTRHKNCCEAEQTSLNPLPRRRSR